MRCFSPLLKVARTIALLGVSAWLSAGVLAASGSAAWAQSSDQLIAAAYKSVQANQSGAQNDLSVLVVTLRKSTTMPEQSELIEALRDLGDSKGTSPPAIKAYLKEVVPLVLLDFARTRSDGRVRGQALLSLRSFEPSDEQIDQAIAIAKADTSADRDFVHQQGELLAKWKQDRNFDLLGADKNRPIDPAAQKKALAFLHKHELEVSYQALLSAVADTNPQTIGMLADAGLQLGGVHTPAAYQAVVAGLSSACRDSAVTPDRVGETFKVLLSYGYRMDASDQYGNELVMSSVQSCPAPVIGRLVDLGVRPNPINKQNTTPLALAIIDGDWEIAQVLVDHGAGMSKQEVDTTFMELPDDPKQKALVERAMQNAGK